MATATKFGACTRIGSLATALLAIAIALAAIDSRAATPTPMHFTHLAIEDGLSQNNVQAIHQDSRGYLWFATENGLNRYDGYSVHRYYRSRDEGDGLVSDYVWEIAEDDNGDLWFATQGGGVAQWHRATDTFSAYRHDPADPDSLSSDDIRTLVVNDDGTLWIGTRADGLNLLDPATGIVRRFRHRTDDVRSLSNDRVYALLLDRTGQLWVGTDGGLNRLMPGADVFQRYAHDARDPASLSDDKVRSLYEDSSGTLWIGTSAGGLNRLRSLAGEFTAHRHDPNDDGSLSSDHVRAIFEDDADRLWIGTADGLNLLRRGDDGFHRYAHDVGDNRSLRDSYINSIAQDRSGLLWVGTRSAGISKWNPRSWTLGPYAQPWLSGADVTSFANDGRGRVWVGTLGAGLARIDESTGRIERLRHDPEDEQTIRDDRVMSLLFDSRDRLWIGTMGAGLSQYDPGSGEFRHYRHDPDDPSSLGADGVMTIFEDRDGRIWAGLYGAGVSVLDPGSGSFRHFRHRDDDATSLSGNQASTIMQTRDGDIWIGTFDGGISRYVEETGSFQRIGSGPASGKGLSSDMVYTIYEDADGNLWVGTSGGGLDKLVSDDSGIRFENFSRDDGLPSDVVYGVQPDAEQRLWLSTNYGLARLDPETRVIKVFHRSHGLQGDEFNYGAHHRGPGGRLYFGGAGGFNAFLPGLVEDRKSDSQIVLTSFQKLGQDAETEVPLDQLAEIRLDYADNVINLGFAALDYAAPRQNRYSYRLEGFDDRWIDLGTQNHVTYTNLDAGSYLLRVRSRASDSSAHSSEFSIPIYKAAPPWATNWAFGAYVSAALALTFLLWRAQRRKFLRELEYSRRLELDVAERTEELEERNRDLEVASRAKSDFLARMSHEIRTPMNGMLGMTQLLMGTSLDEKQRRFARTISSSAASLLEIINDILDFSKIEAGRMQLSNERFCLTDLVEDTVDLFSAPAAEKNIELLCETPPGLSVDVNGDAARLKQVLVNLLANAVKFTAEGEIAASCRIINRDGDNGTIELAVRDTGIGIKAESRDLIFDSFSQEDGTTSRRYGGTGLGLAICQQIVELMEGEIGVDSEPGRGSRFWITLPVRDLRIEDRAQALCRPLQGLRALVVDDNRACRAVTAEYVRALGIAVEVARNPGDAQKMLAEASGSSAFDLLLLDAEQPGENVAEIVRQLRNDRDHSALAIIIMTADATALEDRRWASVGVDGSVSKPLRQSLLADSLLAITGPSAATGDLAAAEGNAEGDAVPVGGRVLLVEDNPVNQAVAVGMLEEFGCDTVVAINGEDAIDKINSQSFDIVLMDCEMPVMDGFAATAAIRKNGGPSNDVPIIAVTANAIDGDRERCLEAGMQDYLAKPITVQKLKGTLQKWLTDRPAEKPASDVLDSNSLASIRALKGVGGDEMVRKVIEIYLTSSATLVEGLRSAISAGDTEQIRQVAHALKASSQNVGAKKVEQLCQRLEQLGRNGCVKEAEQTGRHVQKAYSEAVSALRQTIVQSPN